MTGAERVMSANVNNVSSAQKLSNIPAQLESALVLSRFDYCNAVFADLPSSTPAPLQRALHAVWSSS